MVPSAAEAALFQISSYAALKRRSSTVPHTFVTGQKVKIKVKGVGQSLP